MPNIHSFECACRSMAWQVDLGRSGTHVVCYCRDCASHARHLGHGAMLDAHGGAHIWQTLPDAFTLTKGAEHLAAQRLSPRGLLRWYAGCCNTPIANTLPQNRLPFIGVLAPAPAPAFGRVAGHVQTAQTHGAVREHGFASAGAKLMLRGLGALCRGARDNPFFDVDGQPIREARILTREERTAAQSLRS